MEARLVLDQPSLLLDIGNTNIKYAWYRYPQHIADLQVMRTTIDSLQDLINEASSCWLCSVIDEDIDSQIKRLCEQNNVPVFQAHTQKSQFGINNAYALPSNMGSDRWMGIIAGASLSDQGSQTNFVAIDAGTAITCDFVVGNQHLGGWIAPGLAMSRTAVVSQTKKVFDEHQELALLSLGNNTPECVANGVLAQLVGMLSQACKVMQQNCSAFQIYISGGDAPLLINAFNEFEKTGNKVNLNYLENLVLVGLAKLAHEYMAENG